MKEIKLKVPDDKYRFFIELVQQLGFEVSQEAEILEEHKNIVRERNAAYRKSPDRLLDWEKVKKEL